MKRKLTYLTGALLAALLTALYPRPDHIPETKSETITRSPESFSVERARTKHLSGVWVEDHGNVVKRLADDERGHRHQRFILRLADGKTVLVVHNIDIAPRLPNLRRGESVTFRGEYLYNPKGGLIHWTHHDPSGRKKGGWLRYKGKLYR